MGIRDGDFQLLKLEEGEIRFASPGCGAIEFDVRISPRQTVTYREELRRNSPSG